MFIHEEMNFVKIHQKINDFSCRFPFNVGYNLAVLV